MNFDLTESTIFPLDDAEVDQELYPGEGESESTSPVETGINFQEAMDDPLDIMQIEESIGVSYPPSDSAPDPVIDEPLPPNLPFKQSSKVTDEPPLEVDGDSPPPEPKPLDPSKEYCFCQRLPDSHSMVYCHECLEWFHGECVGITRQKAACIKKFYCPVCIDKNPSLVSVFESRAEGARSVGGSVGKVKGGQEKKSKYKKHSRR